MTMNAWGRGTAMALRATAITAVLLFLLAPSAVGSRSADGHAASALSVSDSAKLRLVSADGNTLYERGKASGTLPGTVEVALTLGAHTASSSFTIRTQGGTITGRGSGKLKLGKGGYDSFGGAVSVQRGTGRFRHAAGKGGLYGSIYRVNDAMSVQVTGTLRY
jgi:hypothetical protein